MKVAKIMKNNYRIGSGNQYQHFNRVEFDTFRSEAGHNYFTMTSKKWIDGVNAIGIISKAGKYNGSNPSDEGFGRGYA